VGKLKELYDHLISFTADRQEADILTMVEGHKETAIDMNTGQLMKGRDAQDKPVDPPYASAAYANFKLYLNPAGVVDLYLTGDFHAAWVMRTNQFPILFSSTDYKTDELRAKYGEEIFGLSKSNAKDFLQNYVGPDVRKYYREKVFKLR
jgi:hypothetical protein